MNIAVLSDIHANREALVAVLEDARHLGADCFCSLGDIIGFNGDPAACIDTMRPLLCAAVRGNHEAALLQRGLFGVPLYTTMMDRTAAMLSAEHLAYIRALPLRVEWQGITLVHASPLQEDTWQRVGNIPAARKAFGAFSGQLCFFGHTHRATIFKEAEGSVSIIPAVYNEANTCQLELEPGSRYLINPGSVGQPRDFNWKAAYALLDTDTATLTLRRVEYDVNAAAAKIHHTGLPDSFAAALRKGITPTGD